MKRINYLRGLHGWYNEREFDGQLLDITILLKRQRSKDGWYEYRARKDWTPIRKELNRACIVVSDGCFDEGTEEETMVHEMVHQWQCEVLNEAPHHNEVFKKKQRYFLEKYGLEI